MKGKTMRIENVNEKTKEAVDYLVQALESGQSSMLTQYLGAMAKFRNYSFGNIMLIARQRAVTCCYTSLESMNMRPCALLEASDGA
jgi:DNA-binding phage protein